MGEKLQFLHQRFPRLSSIITIAPIVALIVSGVWYMADRDAKIRANSERGIKNREDLGTLADIRHNLLQRIASIEERLGIVISESRLTAEARGMIRSQMETARRDVEEMKATLRRYFVSKRLEDERYQYSSPRASDMWPLMGGP